MSQIQQPVTPVDSADSSSEDPIELDDEQLLQIVGGGPVGGWHCAMSGPVAGW